MKTIIMKNGRILTALAMIIILAVVIWLLIVPIGRAEPLDTYHSGWNLVRAAADEDGASFSAVYDLTGVTSGSSGCYDDMSSDAFQIRSRNSTYGLGSSSGTKWAFIICGKCYNNTDDTASFNLVGWSKTNGALQVICEGDIVLGTQAVDTYPEGDDALGELVDESSVTYTHASTKFTVTNEAFDGVVAGMLARVTGTNLTDAIVQVTTATDANNIVTSGITSTDNNTDSTVEINPAFWADTINLDEATKWSVGDGAGEPADIGVLNSGDNEIAMLIVDLRGVEYIQFVFYDCDAATGEEAGDIRVYGRPY